LKVGFVAAKPLRGHHPEDAGLAECVVTLLRNASGRLGSGGILPQHRYQSRHPLDEFRARRHARTPRLSNDTNIPAKFLDHKLKSATWKV
jgi:hypothetical protein